LQADRVKVARGLLQGRMARRNTAVGQPKLAVFTGDVRQAGAEEDDSFSRRSWAASRP
jgi:hypothetical protein